MTVPSTVRYIGWAWHLKNFQHDLQLEKAKR